MNVKILVGYYKKEELFKSDVIVPIHCGRSIAKNKTRYGDMKNDDIVWLEENMIGDNTGENISEMNRDLDELTAIYWAWKNYDKIGNPDYIGLYHYRRFLHLADISDKYLLGSKINRTGNNSKNIDLILKEYDFIVRKGILASTAPYISFECYQPMVNLSESYHPKIYEGYQDFLKEQKFYANDIFIMKREDFFDMCAECFPIMFDYVKHDKHELVESWKKWCEANYDNKMLEERVYKRLQNNNGWCPALPGFMMEYIFSFYFSYLKKRRKSIECDVINPIDIPKCNFIKKIFSIRNQKINGKKKKIIYILGIKITLPIG